MEIQKKGITDNVVTLMAGKIQKLSENTQRVVRLAACIGNSFDLNTCRQRVNKLKPGPRMIFGW